MEENETGIRSNCSICLVDLVQKDRVSALVCGHIYHHACISLWIAEKKQCPKCRRKVPASGFIERLYFDVAGNGEVEPIQQIDYAEMSCKLNSELQAEKEKAKKVEEENSKLKINVKSLEKKVLREKGINEKEIPRLKATIETMSMRLEETNYFERELKASNDKLKACEFYSLLTTHSTTADEKLSQFLKTSGGLHHDKFFELIKAQNKELTSSRKAARDEAQKLRSENFAMKRQLEESLKNIKNLKDEVLNLRDRARVETPVNKRLRNVLTAETPTVAKRRSLGFDDTQADLYGEDWSYFQPVSNDEEAPKPGPSKEPAVEKFSFDADSDDDNIFRKVTPKSASEKKKVEINDSFDDFTFDIPVPKNIIKRIEKTQSTNVILKPSERVVLKRNLSQNSKISKTAMPPVKSARISNFFVRKVASEVKDEDCVTLE